MLCQWRGRAWGTHLIVNSCVRCIGAVYMMQCQIEDRLRLDASVKGLLLLL